MGNAMMMMEFSNFLWSCNEYAGEQELTKLRSRYLANATLACFLLVETDLSECYISAAKAYSMTNHEVSAIFAALVFKAGRGQLEAGLLERYRTWVDMKVDHTLEVQRSEDGGETWRANREVEESADGD